MLEFQDVTLEQIPLLKRYLSDKTMQICDHTPGTVFMWRKMLRTQYYENGSFLLLRSLLTPEKPAFSFPLGNVDEAMAAIREFCRDDPSLLSFSAISEEDSETVLSYFPELKKVPLIDWYDYCYPREQMIDFSGKKLAGQRNHRNYFFKSNPSWRFSPLSKETIPLALDYTHRYAEENYKDSPFFFLELDAIVEALKHWERFSFVGGLLLVEERPVGLTFGEIAGDTVFVHVEKADRAFRGAYPTIASEFLRRCTDETVRLVNREEDMGDPGLRYSKEAYHPSVMMKKYKIERVL